MPRTGSFIVRYVFDSQHSADPKRFFADRAIRFMRMIVADSSEQGIRRVVMECVDESPRRRYTLKIDTSGASCKLPGKRERYEHLGQDPENALIDIMKTKRRS